MSKKAEIPEKIKKMPLEQKKRIVQLKEINYITNTDSILFVLFSMVSVVIVYFITLGLREILFDQMLIAVNDSQSITELLNKLLIFFVLYKLWNIIMLFTITVIINTILAKLLNLQVWRVLVLTIICLVIAMLIFHVINYIVLVYFSPIEKMTLIELLIEYLVPIFLLGGGGELGDFSITSTSFVNDISDFLFTIFYQLVFLDDPSLKNYLILYLTQSGSGTLWLPFNYDYVFIFFIYSLFLFLLFGSFVKSCACTPPVFGYKRENIREVLAELDIKDYLDEERKKGEGV